MIGFAFALVLARVKFFPEQELLRYITLLISVILIGLAYQMVLPTNKTKAKDLQKKKTERAVHPKSITACKVLVLAGVTAACSVSGFCGSYFNVLPGLTYALGFICLMLTGSLVALAAHIKSENNKHDTRKETTEEDFLDEDPLKKV